VTTETKQHEITPDISVNNHGTIFLFEPLTEAARGWIVENVAGETQWFGSALCVEHRYAYGLAAGMVGDDLTLE
jgi:hypothetical protein